MKNSIRWTLICTIRIFTPRFNRISIYLLRQGRLAEIDTDILIDELENMAKSNRRELVSHLIILLTYLLKWQFQLQQLTDSWHHFQGKSWRASIDEQRMQIQAQLEESPSLANYLQDAIGKAYPKAVKTVLSYVR
ncbi:MAG: DUF29 domain-containing protein [Thiotrichaceae bacterium]